MILWSGLPKEAMEDPFKPPDEPCRVRCLHCGREYSSSQIAWRTVGGQGFWCCPMEGCDGAGFNFDIFPIDSDFWDDEEEEDQDDQDDQDDTAEEEDL